MNDGEWQPAPRRRVARLLLGLVVFAVAVVWAVRYALEQQHTGPGIDLTNWPLSVGVAVSLFGVMLINGLILRDLVAHFGVRLHTRAWLGLTLVGSLLNMVSPVRGGAALRAMYLKRVHGVPLSEVTTVLVGSTVCGLAVSAALGAIAIAALGVPGGAYGTIALLSSFLVAAILSVLLWASPPSLAGASPILARLTRVAAGWRSLGERRGLLLRLYVWSGLAAVLHAAAFLLAFRLASFEGAWLVPVASSAFARIGTLLAITPAGLGIFEAFGVVSARIVGAETGAALLGVLAVRVLGTAVTVAGGLVMLPMLLRDGSGKTSRESLSTRNSRS